MRSLLLLALPVLCGCADTVSLELNFPSEDTFVRTETAQVFAFAVGDDFDACPMLLDQAELGSIEGASFATGLRNVCEFRAGAVTLTDIPSDVYAYVAVASDAAGSVLLTGCTISDPYIDAPPLEIVMSPTLNYRRDFGAGSDPPTCSVDEKCGVGCR